MAGVQFCDEWLLLLGVEITFPSFYIYIYIHISAFLSWNLTANK